MLGYLRKSNAPTFLFFAKKDRALIKSLVK